MPQYIYVGDMDDNDAVGFSDGFDLADRDLIYELFGDPVYIWKRWPIAEEIYDSVQNSSQFVIYTGIGHTITGEMFEDIKRFFDMPAGDINDDWSVNLSDAILVLQVLAGMNPANVHRSADVNYDGKISTAELLFILQKVSGMR